MKTNILFTLLFLSTICAFSQNLKNVIGKKITCRKEDISIDSIMAANFKFINSKNCYLTIKVRQEQSDFWLEINKVSYSQSIVQLKFVDITKISNLSYFNYNKTFVFVMGDIDEIGLFRKTLKRKAFKFKIFKDELVPTVDDLSIYRRYLYRNGKFFEADVSKRGY